MPKRPPRKPPETEREGLTQTGVKKTIWFHEDEAEALRLRAFRDRRSVLHCAGGGEDVSRGGGLTRRSLTPLLFLLALLVAGFANGQDATDLAPPLLTDEKKMGRQDGSASDAGKDDQPQQEPIPKHQPNIEPAAKHDPDQRQRTGDGWEKWVATGSLVTNVLLVVAGILGWLVIRGQLREMQKTNEQAERASVESRRQADAALVESKRQAVASRAQSGADAAASLEVARKSLEESRRTVEMTQRARLAIEPDTFEIIMDSSGQPLSATVRIKNVGVLPATDVRHQVVLEAAENSAVLDEPMSIPPGPGLTSGMTWPRSVIGGGTSMAIEPVFSRAGLNLVDVLARGHFVFVHGKVQYDDGFGNDRTLRFCAYNDKWGALAGKPIGTGTWKPCHNHNWTD